MTGQINLNGRDRDPIISYGIKIGSGPCILLRPGWPDPVNAAPSRILALDDRLRLMTMSETRCFKTLKRIQGHVGYIDIENGIAGKW